LVPVTEDRLAGERASRPCGAARLRAPPERKGSGANPRVFQDCRELGGEHRI